MIRIIKSQKGNAVGECKLKKEDVKKLFDFCKSFDISNITGQTDYIFDVRSEAIHWLDPKTKDILSSLYCDLAKGNVKIESAGISWDRNTIIKKWAEVINTAVKGES